VDSKRCTEIEEVLGAVVRHLTLDDCGIGGGKNDKRKEDSGLDI